ncbi:hypothetical protein DQ04_07661040 [Trypanosoma grayi]|uniref:hypothetical protein n=1 Tax=Trypanosoma grayi TaxID=71804 RepID=UPI0004F40714|nr:hypothetical protein DQ04_07661040 [Trypanosoma grayi]KEG08237.1 hypothetical protein DQ04_07661040 [Trypanosoma grayi]
MASPLPKKYYLLVHDAIRKVVGSEAEISAFVKSKRPFQCDMLVNAAATDPELANSSSDNNNAYVKEFAVKLQHYLGSCDVVVRRRRLDVVFIDREVLQLALGAPRRAINNLQRAEEINEEPAWTRRNRLRISLGHDEDLFTSACDLKTSLAARMMEKWVFDTYYTGPNSSRSMGTIDPKEDVAEFLQQQCPPVTYWLAHGYLLARECRVDHHVALLGTIAHNFAKYYGKFPLDNPYCPGEDLNTIATVQALCRAWKQLPLEDGGIDCELRLGTPPPEQKP